MLAAQILACQSWVAAVEAMDAVSTAINKKRAIAFKSALKHISVENRQHLVRLLKHLAVPARPVGLQLATRIEPLAQTCLKLPAVQPADE